MKLWNRKEKKTEIKNKEEKMEALKGVANVCDYFRANIENNILFTPEYETASAVNAILSNNEILSEVEIIQVINLINDIDKTEHYDGSGWFDYRIRLSYFLRLCGINTEVVNDKLLLVG